MLLVHLLQFNLTLSIFWLIYLSIYRVKWLGAGWGEDANWYDITVHLSLYLLVILWIVWALIKIWI